MDPSPPRAAALGPGSDLSATASGGPGQGCPAPRLPGRSARPASAILVSAGGFGVRPVEALIHGLLELQYPAQLVVICGRSEELKGPLAEGRKPAGARAPRVHLVGHTTEIDEYMAAPTWWSGKPGGLTSSEALARGLALVIVHPTPGREERNADRLLEADVVIRCNNLPALAWKIDRLLGDPARLTAMRANATSLARPHAARDIAATLIG